MEEQSDTPRTDAAAQFVSHFGWQVHADFARALERELATAMRERDEARAEIERLITEVERLRGRLIGKRAIFQAGRDSYKTNCQPMNTDDEAWAEFVVSQEAKP